MSFTLFSDSSHILTFDPEYDYTKQSKKIEDRHRVRSGKEYVYKWGDYDEWKFGVRFVNSSFRYLINDWWNTNTDLLFVEYGSTQINSVRIINGSTPIGKFEMPYYDLFSGVIELGTY